MRKETGLLHIDLFEFLPKKSTIGLRTRAGGIRTHDLLNPIQALYQAEPRPVFQASRIEWNPGKRNRIFPDIRAPGSGGPNGRRFSLNRRSHELFDAKLRDERKMI